MGTPGTVARWRGRDLDNPDEIAEMVHRFYADVAQDDLLGPIFNDVAKVDWSEHMTKLTAFWCRSLLSLPDYQGNPLRQHQQVHAIRPFTAAHFERWLALFHETVDEGWVGARADQAKAFAGRVAAAHSRLLATEPAEWSPVGMAP